MRPFELKISAFELHLTCEGDANLVQTKIPIFALGRMDLWYCGMYIARTCRACTVQFQTICQSCVTEGSKNKVWPRISHPINDRRLKFSGNLAKVMNWSKLYSIPYHDHFGYFLALGATDVYQNRNAFDSFVTYLLPVIVYRREMGM